MSAPVDPIKVSVNLKWKISNFRKENFDKKVFSACESKNFLILLGDNLTEW